MPAIKKANPNITMPTLAIRGMVAFPNVTMHFDVRREKSINAIKATMAINREIFIITQSNIEAEEPHQKDLYKIGVVCEIKQLLRSDENTIRLLIEGKYNFLLYTSHISLILDCFR